MNSLTLTKIFDTISEQAGAVKRTARTAASKAGSKGTKAVTKGAKGTRAALSATDAKIAELVGLDAALAAKGMNEEMSILKKRFAEAVRSDFKQFGVTGTMGRKADEYRKMMTARDLKLASDDAIKNGRALTKKEVTAIKNRNEIYARDKFAELQAKALGKVPPTKPGGTTPTPPPPVKPTVKPKPILPKVWKALKTVWILKLAGLGLLAGLTIAGINALRKRLKPGEEEATKMPPCIGDLLSKPGCTLESTSATEGDPVIVLTQTGEEEYDKAGGLKFYMNNTVTYANGKRKGRWQCKGETAEIVQEENDALSDIFENILIEQDINAGRVDRLVRRTARNLKGNIDRGDLQTIYRILNRVKDAKYDGQDAITLIQQDYERLHGRNLINDVQSVTTGLDQRGILARKNLLALLQSKAAEVEAGTEGGEAGAGGGKPLDNIVITWDGDSTTPGGGGAGKSKYSWCEAMPFQFGCHNDRIREIQLCLGLPEKYQTGNFGPITSAKLKEVGYDISGGITEDIYRDVLARCNKFGTPAQTATPEREKPIERVQPIKPAAIPSVAPKLDTGLRPSTQPPIDRQKAILNNVRRDRKYVGPPLNDAETRWLNSWMKSIGNTDIEKAKEKVLYGK